MIYWTDVALKRISCAHLDGGDEQVIIDSELLSPEGLAVDTVARNLYWTDYRANRIEVSKLDGSSRKVLVSEDLDGPLDVVLDTRRGWVQDPRKVFKSLGGSKVSESVCVCVCWRGDGEGRRASKPALGSLRTVTVLLFSEHYGSSVFYWPCGPVQVLPICFNMINIINIIISL